MLEKLKFWNWKEEIIKEIKENREEIPERVLEEFKGVREVTSKPIARKILKILEENNGRINVTELRNECETSDVCSKPTFYKYLKKLEYKGIIERVKEGKKVYVRSSSKTIIDISK